MLYIRCNFSDMKKSLLLFGLSETEANQFMNLVDKLKVPESEIEAIEKEFESGFPFEGGASTEEAIILLVMANRQETLEANKG